MTSYWTEFAYTGNPGTGRDKKETYWASWKENDMTSLILDTERDSGIRMISNQYTMKSVKEEFMSDQFKNDEQKCDLYKSTFRGEHFIQDEYDRIAESGCI